MKQISAIVALILMSFAVSSAFANGPHVRGGYRAHNYGYNHGYPSHGYGHRRPYYPAPVYPRYPSYPNYPTYPVAPAPLPLPPPVEQQVIIQGGCEAAYGYGCEQQIPCQTVAPCGPVATNCSYGCPAILPNTFPAESYYCPSNYCGQQLPANLGVRPIQLPTNFALGGFCQQIPLGGNFFALILNGTSELSRGPLQQVRYMWSLYRQNGVCR